MAALRASVANTWRPPTQIPAIRRALRQRNSDASSGVLEIPSKDRFMMRRYNRSLIAEKPNALPSSFRIGKFGDAFDAILISVDSKYFGRFSHRPI